MEQTDQFSLLNQQCEIHQKARLSFASLSPNTKNPLSCSVCLFANKNYDTNISIEEILINDETTPISNWPPGISLETYDFLQNKQTSLLKVAIQEGITIFYEGLISEINQLLIDSQKSQLMELDKIQIGSEELIVIYNQLFKRKELFDIFSNKKQIDPDNYLNLLNSLKETSNKDLQEISEKIEEKKKIEIEFRRFQKLEVQQLLDNIFIKLNKLSPQLYTHSENKVKLEDFDYGCYCTVSEADSKFVKLKTNLMNIQIQLNQYEKKSTWMMSEYHKFEINYLTNGIINISNPSKNSGSIETYFNYYFNKQLSFKIKFKTFTSFESFSLSLVAESEKRQLVITELLNNIKDYFKNKRDLQLQFLVRIKEHEIQLETDGFNQKDNISLFSKDESRCKIRLQLNQNCEEFQLSEYYYQ